MGESERDEEYSAGIGGQYPFDLERLLAEGRTICIRPRGTSMYPMFASEDDEAVIAPADAARLRPGDVALYRRDPQAGGILVLHRIYRRDGDKFYMAGDNQSIVEGPLRADQMRGVLVAWTRKGRSHSVKNIFYRFFFGLWRLMLPLRDPIHRAIAFVRKMSACLPWHR